MQGTEISRIGNCCQTTLGLCGALVRRVHGSVYGGPPLGRADRLRLPQNGDGSFAETLFRTGRGRPSVPGPSVTDLFLSKTRRVAEELTNSCRLLGVVVVVV